MIFNNLKEIKMDFKHINIFVIENSNKEKNWYLYNINHEFYEKKKLDNINIKNKSSKFL